VLRGAHHCSAVHACTRFLRQAPVCECDLNAMDSYPDTLTAWTAQHVIRFAKTKVAHNLKDDQVRAIVAILHGQSTLVVAHTGWGKSLLFHVAIAIMNTMDASATALIVTPTIALMQVWTAHCTDSTLLTGEQEHTRNAATWGAATFVGSSQEEDVESQLRSFAFIFLSPEKLEDANFVNKLKALNVRLIVLDEAHLAADYKHWRSSYATWHTKLQACNGVPVKLFLTGTLQIQDQKELLESCNLTEQDTCVIRCSADKDNVNISVQRKAACLSDVAKQVLKCCSDAVTNKELSIVFVGTRKEAAAMCQAITAEGHASVRFFHSTASLPPAEKARMEAANADTLKQCHTDLLIVVATAAFSVGVSFNRCKTVVHTCVPSTFSEYVQQIGRAGRSGEVCNAVLFFRPEDVDTYFHCWVKSEEVSLMDSAAGYAGMLAYIYSDACRRRLIRQYFDATPLSFALAESSRPCKCDNCARELDVIVPLQQAMVTLLGCIKEFSEPTCLTKIETVLWGRNPKKHSDPSYSGHAYFGKGLEMYRSSKQEKVWLHLITLATNASNMRFVVESHHIGRRFDPTRLQHYDCIFRRFQITAAGADFLQSSQLLNVTERFTTSGYWNTKSTSAEAPVQHGTLCSVSGCLTKLRSNGMCEPHYKADLYQRNKLKAKQPKVNGVIGAAPTGGGGPAPDVRTPVPKGSSPTHDHSMSTPITTGMTSFCSQESSFCSQQTQNFALDNVLSPIRESQAVSSIRESFQGSFVERAGSVPATQYHKQQGNYTMSMHEEFNPYAGIIRTSTVGDVYTKTHTCLGLLQCPTPDCPFTARPMTRTANSKSCGTCNVALLHTDCNVVTTSKYNWDTQSVCVHVNEDHAHAPPPWTHLQPDTQAAIKRIHGMGMRLTGNCMKLRGVTGTDVAADSARVVDAFLKKCDVEIFGHDMGIGGIRKINDYIANSLTGGIYVRHASVAMNPNKSDGFIYCQTDYQKRIVKLCCADPDTCTFYGDASYKIVVTHYEMTVRS
jgi:superfamily II DNA helicase RecQ